MNYSRVVQLTAQFEAAARGILCRAEDSSARVITLDSSYKSLTGMSLKQDELFRQSLRCVENKLYRAAHVMAWAGLIDFAHEKLGEDGYQKLNAARPKWSISSPEDMRQWSDYQVIEALRDVGLCRKAGMKALHGLLNRRNECAHPEDYHPGLNEALGYISELLQRLEALKKRPL